MLLIHPQTTAWSVYDGKPAEETKNKEIRRVNDKLLSMMKTLEQKHLVYHDCDRMGVKDVMKQFEIALDQSCHEVDLDTFIQMTDKKSYGMVSNLTKAEVYAFREAAKGYVFNYSVVADGEKYAIVGSDMGEQKKYTIPKR